MMFLADEKIFSLSKTVDSLPRSNIVTLWEEFYCYLLVAGLYREGEGREGVHYRLGKINDKNFLIPEGSYNAGLAKIITKGLADRLYALQHHQDINRHEENVLAQVEGIFSDDRRFYSNLTGKDLFKIAVGRSFSDPIKTVAAYVAVAFGQRDFPAPATVAPLYLSKFGNIHLSKTDVDHGYGPYLLSDPSLIYGTTTDTGETVTALWTIMSSLAPHLSQRSSYPGDTVGDIVSGLGFLTQHSEFEASVPLPSYASALYLEKLMGSEGLSPISISHAFYQDFLYGSCGKQNISRRSMLIYILNLMMKKIGETYTDHLFCENSLYKKLSTTISIGDTKPKRPKLFQFALEALATDLDTQEDDDSSLEQADEGAAVDPTQEEGYDPTQAPPLTPPIENKIENSIDLLSFDKTGEGVNEDLYRQAVVALNAKLKSDATLSISADVRDALDYWVNGFLYRTAISATKDQISLLKLQSYLKPLNTKG